MDVWACFLHQAYVFLRMCPQHSPVVVFQVWICGPVILSLHDLGSIEVAILKLHSKTYLYAIASSIKLQKSTSPNEAATLDNSLCMHPILKYQLNWLPEPFQFVQFTP